MSPMGVPSHHEQNGPDWYAVLGVDPCATLREIRVAYRRKAQALHAERLHATAAPRTLARAYHRLKALSDAYRTLRTPDTRRAYDLAREARLASVPEPTPPVRRTPRRPGSAGRTPARSEEGRRRQLGRIAVVIGFGVLVLVAVAINIVERRQVEATAISGAPPVPTDPTTDR